MAFAAPAHPCASQDIARLLIEEGRFRRETAFYCVLNLRLYSGHNKKTEITACLKLLSSAGFTPVSLSLRWAAGFYTLVTYKVITMEQTTGRVYLLCTLVTAVTALMIYKHGGFGPGHALAILTLLALAAGFLVTKISALSGIAPYFQALCFSGTLLFHMIPAITDGLLRLPTDDPVLTDPRDPILQKFYLLFLVIFLVGYALQVRWLKNQRAS